MKKRILCALLTIIFALAPTGGLKTASAARSTGFGDYIDILLPTVIGGAKTDEDIVKAVYDFIIYRFAHYNTNVRDDAQKIVNSKRTTLPSFDGYTDTQTFSEMFALSLFRNGEGVCDNFAAAFAVMLNHAGVECETWGGDYVNRNGTKMPHAWNRAKIDGKWYWFDVDVEGTVFRRDQGKIIYFQYKLTDEQMKGSHENFRLLFAARDVTTVKMKVGTKLGDVLYTDIRAFINGAEIQGYNIGGATYVIAADLRNYGFNVVYDDYSRTSTISFDARKAASPMNVAANAGRVGEPAFPYLYTDITAVIFGAEVESRNVNGNIAVPFNALRAFGDYFYDGVERKCKLITLTGVN